MNDLIIMNKINKDDSIFLYAEGKYEGVIKNNLRRKGYKINGIIDKRYNDELSLEKENKISFDKYVKEICKDNDVVIICLGDASKHDGVADVLARHGLHKILYLSTDVNVSISYKSKLRLVYRSLILGDFSEILIPEYQNGSNNNMVIIEQLLNETVFWCPIEYLYTHGIEERFDIIKPYIKSKENSFLWERYLDIPIVEYKPYIDLFRSMKSEEVDASEYFDMNRNTKDEKEELKANRKTLFEKFEFSYKYDFGFFTEGASYVVWNKKGYFNILDGNHRIAYLITKGHHEVPVIAANVDYMEFLRMKQKENRFVKLGDLSF